MPSKSTPSTPTSQPAPDSALAESARAVPPEAGAPDALSKIPAVTGKKTRRRVICPYCGEPTPVAHRCETCRGLLDPLSRQASQNAMGPWFIRDDANPFRPGCSYETVVAMAKRGRIDPHTIIRGPTTKQFWCAANATPGVSHLFGVCYQCQADVQPNDGICDDCGADFTIETDRQHLGLNPVEPLPGQPGPANESGIVSTPIGIKNSDNARATGVPTHDLDAAITVLSRRLRNQTRLVNGLATSVIALLVTLVGLGVWFVTNQASKINVGFIAGASPDHARPTPAPADPDISATTSTPVQPPAPSASPPAPAPEATRPAPDHPTEPPTTPTAPPPPIDPTEQKITDLIAKDTTDSLTKALELLPAEGTPDSPAAARRRAVQLRLEQLKLRGLP